MQKISWNNNIMQKCLFHIIYTGVLSLMNIFMELK